MDFLMRNIDKYKGLIVGGVTTGLAVLSAIPPVRAAAKTAELGLEAVGLYGDTQEGASIREQMMQMGMPPAAATTIGAAKTASKTNEKTLV